MSKKFRIGTLAIALCMLAMGQVNGQVDIIGHTGGTGQHVGWDNMTTIPLEIRHDAGDQPIEWYTTGDGISEMWLTPTLTNFFLNGMNPSLDVSGNLGVGNGFSMTTPPLTLLHLKNNSNTIPMGFRDWMRAGVLSTQETDGMYVGLMDIGSAFDNPAIINWSSNALGAIDPLRFTFTCGAGSPGVFGTNEGLELVRLLPLNTGNEGYFGIGDFNTASVNPTERLDVLNGRVRIRQLPDAANEDPTLTKVVLVDDPNPVTGERGVLKWAEISDLIPDDCEWTMNATSPNHVYTAVGGAVGDCPDNFEAVAVGLDLSSGTPPAKFTTLTRDFATAVQVTNSTTVPDVRGVSMDVSNGTSNNFGIDVRVNNPNQSILANVGARYKLTGPAVRTRGVQAETHGGTWISYAGDFISYDPTGYESFGVQGLVRGGNLHSIGVSGTSETSARYSYGVRGTSHGSTSSNSTSRHYGVLGLASVVTEGQVACAIRGEAPSNVSNSWAVWAEGRQFSSTDSHWFFPSDENLKLNIEDFEGALNIIQQLQPKTYEYNLAEYGFMHLAEGPKIGLIAQELEAVLPNSVVDVHQPEQVDSVGNVISPAVDFKAMSYDGFIPILIGAVKEQQAQITGQQATIAAQQATIDEQAAAIEASGNQVEELVTRMDQLEQLLALCCEAPAIDPDLRNLMNDNDPQNDRLLNIQPNPFNERTTIHYQLEKSGRMQLMANSSDGKQLRVLQEAQMEAGRYQFEWLTADLAPGIYYVTMLLDQEPLVKRAVKVN